MKQRLDCSNLNKLPWLVRSRQDKNKDCLVVTTGEKGDGKSNFIMQFAWRYLLLFGLICKNCFYEWIYDGQIFGDNGKGQWRVINKNWIQPCPKCKSNNVTNVKKLNFKLYMGYDNKEVFDRIRQLPKYSPLLGDEAARWAMGQDWALRENRDIKRKFIQIRTKRLVVFANIPEFATLDSKYRNMADYWVRVLQRDDKHALAIILRKSKGETIDKWQIDLMHKILKDYFEETDMDELEYRCERLMHRHPCVFDYFKIPPLPDRIYKDYEKYRDEKVWMQDEEEPELTKKDYAKIVYYNLRNNWPKIKKIMDKKEYPSYKILSKVVSKNPITNNPTAQPETVRRWVQAVENERQSR